MTERDPKEHSPLENEASTTTSQHNNEDSSADETATPTPLLSDGYYGA